MKETGSESIPFQSISRIAKYVDYVPRTGLYSTHNFTGCSVRGLVSKLRCGENFGTTNKKSKSASKLN